jgi:hypothetical protein
MNNPLLYTDPSGYNWFKKIKKFVITVVVIAAVIYTAGAASSALLGGLTGTGGTAFATYSAFGAAQLTTLGAAVAGAAGGFAGGFLASALNGGNLSESLKAGVIGGIGGAIGGAISSYYGSTYPIERVGANTIAGGIQSRLDGGSFEQGARRGFMFSALAYLNVQMRHDMVEQSKIDVRNDGSGKSAGMFGDFFKLAGGRFDTSIDSNVEQCSLLGCRQNGTGKIFGMSYSSGGIIDLVTESFAGPHDKANSPWFYQANGLIKDFGGKSTFMLDLMTNYTSSLIFATPFAAGAIYEQVGYGGYSNTLKKHKK